MTINSFIKSLFLFYCLSIFYPYMGFLSAQDSFYDLTANGTDPTEIRSRMDLYFVQVTSRASRDLFGSQLSGDYALSKNLSAGIDLPYIHTELSGGRIGAGIGDIAFRGLLNIYRRDHDRYLKSSAIGIKLVLDTGSADEGTGDGKYAVAPNIAATYTLADEFFLSPVIELFSTFGGDSTAVDIHELHIKLLTVITFSEGIWISLRPELIIDLTGEFQASYPLRTIVGIMLSENFGLSAQYTHFLAGDERVNYFANVDLRYLF